ncbi:MAG: mobile mystery protein A [Phycisphaerae bacterium]
MKAKQIKLVREQLDSNLKQLEPLRNTIVPNKGWIRAIRDAIGMTGQQLAKRMNVKKQRVARIEQDERLGKCTLKTLKNAAQALDCIFVYGFLPNNSLEKIVKQQAQAIAKKRMARTNQTMRLEQQELSENEKEKALKALTEDIINTMPKTLWDEQ